MFQQWLSAFIKGEPLRGGYVTPSLLAERSEVKFLIRSREVVVMAERVVV